MKFSNAISGFRTPYRQNPLLIVMSVLFFALWAWTYLFTSDIDNWYLENALTILTVVALFVCYRKMQFSDLTYLLMFIYLSLHIYGAMHTYAENPFGYWLMETFGFERNHYDRIVHFSFGFLLAYPMREIFLVGFKYPVWVAWLLPIEITLSFSGFYELVEWAVADLFYPERGVAFLGTQGDIWDAQKDIALAFTGAIVATTIVSLIKKTFRIE